MSDRLGIHQFQITANSRLREETCNKRILENAFSERAVCNSLWSGINNEPDETTQII